MTFSVKPSSVTCVGSNVCLANAAISANIGSRYWTSQNDQNAYSGAVSFAVGVVGGGFNTTITLGGNGTLSPLPNILDPARLLLVNLSLISFPSNPLSSGTLPAGLPTPDAVAASNAVVQFEAALVGETAFFSYKGQTCAAPNPVTVPPTINAGGVVPLYSSSTTIQPGSWVSIFGSNLAGTPTTWNGDFPTLLGGTSATINGKPAYLWYVSPNQINL
jgi:hypothetical protein